MRIWGDRLYHLSITSAFVVTGFGIGAIGFASQALAQNSIVPDNTLGNENSQINRETIRGIESDRISGGARRGQNLFHSFERFDIGEGLGAYFDSPEAVRNIFSRVTGSDRSEILGRLGVIQAGSSDVLGNANLFFINPNGILFGPNASLDLGGSFAATTANGMQFGEQGFFSATNSETPSQLLTIDPSAFFFNQVVAQPINQFGPPNQPNSAGYIEGLRVLDGRSLLLLGGQINIQDGRLRASGGRLELGGVAGAGTVGLGINGDQFSLNFPEDLDRADIFITGLADIDVTGGGGGDIAMYARNLNILNGSDVCAGIGPTESCGSQTSNFGMIGSQAGDLVLDAQETIRIADPGSEVTNSINNNSIGNGGTVFIQAGSLFLTNSGRIRASVFGQGNAGGVTINVRNQIVLDNSGSVDNLRSGIFSTVVPQGIGSGGDIKITTDSLSLTAGSLISAATLGQQGNAGNVVIHARGDISLDGMNRNRITPPSGIFTTMEGIRGQSGNIRIFARSLSFTGGAQLVTRTFGEGDAGNVYVRATDSISFRGRVPGFTGEGERDVFSSGILTDNISGKGNAGETDIAANFISISGGAQLTNITFGEGDASRIIINADWVSINGTGPEVPDGRSPSGAFGQVGRRRVVGDDGQGDGGRIEVTTGLLSLTNGGQLSTSTFAQGNAGDIVIRADRISIDGMSVGGEFSSGIFSSVNQRARGSGGDIEIITGSLSLTNGGQINASTFAQGNAGNITIHARDRVLFDGISANGQFWSGTFSAVGQDARGRGRNITINTRDLSLTNRGRISAESTGTGQAGDITLNLADRLQVSNGQILTSAEQASGGAITINAENADVRLSGTSDISTSVGSGAGSGGNIAVTAETIELQDDSDIRTSVAGGQGSGGNIRLRATSILAFDDSDIIAAAPEGQGGDIAFDTDAFFGENYFGSDDRSSQRLTQAELAELDRNGQVDINASGQVSSGTITTPDTSFIQNSLTDLPESAIDTENLVANSCVVRSQEQSGTFIITGAEGLPQRPGDASFPTYPTGEVRSVPDESSQVREWQMGDPIVEPQGVYQLSDGRLLLSRECSEEKR